MRSTIALFASSRRNGNTGRFIGRIADEPDLPFIDAFRETFRYLGMAYGRCVNANCSDGYVADKYEDDIQAFISDVQSAAAY